MSVNSAWSSTKFSANKSCTNWPVLEPEKLIQPLSLFPFLFGGERKRFWFPNSLRFISFIQDICRRSTIGRSSRWETEIWGDGLLRGEDRKIQRQTVDFVKKVLSELLTHQITPITLTQWNQDKFIQRSLCICFCWICFMYMLVNKIDSCFLFWNNWECKNCLSWWLQQVMMEKQFAAFYCVSKILESTMIYQQLVALHKASLSKQISVWAFVVDLILVHPSFSSQFLWLSQLEKFWFQISRKVG